MYQQNEFKCLVSFLLFSTCLFHKEINIFIWSLVWSLSLVALFFFLFLKNFVESDIYISVFYLVLASTNSPLRTHPYASVKIEEVRLLVSCSCSSLELIILMHTNGFHPLLKMMWSKNSQMRSSWMLGAPRWSHWVLFLTLRFYVPGLVMPK